MKTIVLGAGGRCGRQIAAGLAERGIGPLVLAGRNMARLGALRDELSDAHPGLEVATLAADFRANRFTQDLRTAGAGLLVHAAGPFQKQDYRVAEACLSTGTHYIDLADARNFVANFGNLDNEARDRQLLLVSGAGLLPGVSAAVVDAYRHEFETLQAIDIALLPGGRVAHGPASVRAALSWAGKPVEWWDGGAWRCSYGWQSLRRVRYPHLGVRWQATGDAPDLALFPRHYPGRPSVSFAASLTPVSAQWGLFALAGAHRMGLVRDCAAHAGWMGRVASWLSFLAGEEGGMRVSLTGIVPGGARQRVDWYLFAADGRDAAIAALPAVLIASRLSAGTLETRGARPCIGLISLAEFESAAGQLNVSWRIGREELN